MNFLKENWLWIVAPVVTVLIILAILMMMGDGGPSDDYSYHLGG